MAGYARRRVPKLFEEAAGSGPEGEQGFGDIKRVDPAGLKGGPDGVQRHCGTISPELIANAQKRVGAYGHGHQKKKLAWGSRKSLVGMATAQRQTVAQRDQGPGISPSKTGSQRGAGRSGPVRRRS